MLKSLFALAAVGIMLCTSFAGADVPDSDGICDGDEPAGVVCEVIAGPGAIAAGPLLLGTQFCQEQTSDIPLQCEGTEGAINGYGAATFGDPTWVGPRLIEIVVVNDQQTCTMATSPPCGFTVNICNDRDQDSSCNIEPGDEVFQTSTRKDVLFGNCHDQGKDCASMNQAGWSGCMSPSIFGDWSEDQIIVFISNEVGPAMKPTINSNNPLDILSDIDPNNLLDTTAAVAIGTFTVWLEEQGTTSGCNLDTGVLPACSDGYDNDRDGLHDALDPGCHSDENPANLLSYNTLDDDEHNEILPACRDGYDNDFDDRTDILDPACHTDRDATNPASYVPEHDDESDPACSDNQDNDFDDLADSADMGCRTEPGNPSSYNPFDNSEENSVCSDGIDNDRDSRTDFPNDQGCSSADDGSERNTTVCDDGRDNDGDSLADFPNDRGCHSPSDSDETNSETLTCTVTNARGGTETFITIEGEPGTTATCIGDCPTTGAILNAAQWHSGPGSILVTVEGCGAPPGSSEAIADSNRRWHTGESVPTSEAGQFSCTVSIISGPASGRGMCNDPPVGLPL